jgi:hypothetical protein
VNGENVMVAVTQETRITRKKNVRNVKRPKKSEKKSGRGQKKSVKRKSGSVAIITKDMAIAVMMIPTQMRDMNDARNITPVSVARKRQDMTVAVLRGMEIRVALTAVEVSALNTAVRPVAMEAKLGMLVRRVVMVAGPENMAAVERSTAKEAVTVSRAMVDKVMSDEMKTSTKRDMMKAAMDEGTKKANISAEENMKAVMVTIKRL